MNAMKKPQVVHLGSEIALCSARYQPHFDLQVLADGTVPAGFAGRHATALIAAAPVPAEVIAALPALRLIAVYGVGYDKVDLAAARARGIAVTNTPGPTDGCVADMAFALLLAAARGIVSGDRFVRDGKWQSGSYPLMPRLHSRPMGILGMGRIGQAIAKRAAAFDMKVLYHNRRPVPGSPYAYRDSVLALAQDCELLMVACPGGEATRGLVNAEILRALGQRGIVVFRTFNEGEEIFKPSGRPQTGQWTIDPRDGRPRGFAFVWRRYAIEGQPAPLPFCVMATVAANDLIRRTVKPQEDDPRMPAILDDDAWATWLGEDGMPPASARALLKTMEGVNWTSAPGPKKPRAPGPRTP